MLTGADWLQSKESKAELWSGAYAVNGQLVERITSSGDVATLQLYQHGIYLIQTPVKTYKIHY